MGGSFEFRQVEGFETEVMVSAFVRLQTGGERLDSLSHYGFSLNQGSTVRPVSRTEWERGDPLTQIRLAVPGPSLAAPSPDFRVTEIGLVHKGRTYAKSGARWTNMGTTPTRISLDGRYLAMFSFEGNVASYKTFDWSLPTWLGSPIKGTYFVDVYNTESAQRALAIRGSFRVVSPDDIQASSFWLKRHYYVLPLSVDGMKKVLICDVSSADPVNRPAAGKRSIR